MREPFDLFRQQGDSQPGGDEAYHGGVHGRRTEFSSSWIRRIKLARRPGDVRPGSSAECEKQNPGSTTLLSRRWPDAVAGLPSIPELDTSAATVLLTATDQNVNGDGIPAIGALKSLFAARHAIGGFSTTRTRCPAEADSGKCRLGSPAANR